MFFNQNLKKEVQTSGAERFTKSMAVCQALLKKLDHKADHKADPKADHWTDHVTSVLKAIRALFLLGQSCPGQSSTAYFRRKRSNKMKENSSRNKQERKMLRKHGSK